MTRLHRASGRDRLCLACGAKSCCSYYTVTVTGSDLVRIARAMQLAPADFLSACTVPDKGPGTFLLSPGGQQHALTLAKLPLPDRNASPCIFLLKTNNGHGLCGLGDLRPGQCRTFPSYLADGFVAVVNNPPGCGRTWSYGDLDLDEERGRIAQVKSEEAEYHAIVEEWNCRVREEGRERSFEEFCTFLINRTMKREGSGASGPCSSCRKRCCTSYTVSITGYDAWVIGKGLHLPLESFLIHFPVSEQNDRGFLLEPRGRRHEIALDKVGQYQKGNPCVFWVELASGGGRCGIYSHRPMVCQTYPAYQLQEMVVLRDDVLCPEGAWNLVGMDLPVFRKRLSLFRMEQDVYAWFVANWNRAVEQRGRAFTISEYYTALMNVYEQLHEWMESVDTEALERLAAAWGEQQPGAPNPLFADAATPESAAPWRDLIAEMRRHLRRAAPGFAESAAPVSEVFSAAR